MAANEEPEIVLYDLACIKNECFSPVVWRIRLMLNYKKIPYRTIFVEFPDIEATLNPLGIPPNEEGKYTVPAIQHIPTNKYIMDSTPISKFIESTYPDPPVPLTSDLGNKIAYQARSVAGATFRASLMPREINILSPRSQEFFRRTREASLGHPLEDMLDPEKEEQAWKALDSDMQAIGELMRTNKAEGPFIWGAKPSYADFFIAGSLQCARLVDEGVFQRNMKYAGFRDVYEACVPYMKKRD